MALRDELDRIAAERQSREAHIMSDEAVYAILIKAMYQAYVEKPILRAAEYGEKTVKGEFSLSFAMNIGGIIPLNMLSDNSSIYEKHVGNASYSDPDSCGFRELSTYRNGLFSTKVSLTPLGERVYRDLKRLAQKDNVVLSAPFPHVSTSRYSSNTGSMHVTFNYQL